MTNLEKMLSLVRSGKIGFRDFVLKTRNEFRKMACYLSRKWVPPEWFSLEDIEQELYLGSWKYIPLFNPARGVTLSRYVVYNAMSYAKARLHKARGVTISGSPDKKLSHIETPLTFFGDDGEGEALMASILAETPKAEETLIREEERKEAVAKALQACENRLERYTVLAIREAGSLDAASQVLYDDIDHRIALRLSSEEHAERFVFRHANVIASRMQVAG